MKVNILTSLLANVAENAANTSQTCLTFVFEEAECPEELL